MPRVREDDINLLLPTFRGKVQELLDAMRALGYKPVLVDGLRTTEEALANARKGSGIIDSIHCYGAAADLICGDHLWSCAKARCKFFTKLGQQAEALGFVWGGRFPKVDLPHVQGVTVAGQAALRRLGRGPDGAAARDALVAAHFAKRAA